MGNFGTKPAGDRRPAILFRSVCDREARIVKLARSARDKTLKSHVARYEIERTMWSGKRMN